MYLKRIFPNYFAHRAILLGLRKKGDISEARKYFDTLTTMTEDIVLYNIMMDGYVNLGNINGMLELLREMKEKAVHPTHVTGTVVIKGLCQQGKLQEAVQSSRLRGKAFQLHNEMLMHNLKPTPVTYNVLINGLCVYGDLNDADRLLISVDDCNINLSKDLKSPLRDYSAVINRLCKRTLTTEAKYFFSMMLSDGISPDQELCKVMLNAFRRGGDSSSVFQLLAEMIKSGFPPD
ncbi:hypothetical protein M0R45_022033 [Rubus argutus]|uniref:Pentatricopeptide repeat-containing protein n=1 Tax=Rubus argutus TaxID=59490 RepID=A0AAW1XFM5_RUBAR